MRTMSPRPCLNSFRSSLERAFYVASRAANEGLEHLAAERVHDEEHACYQLEEDSMVGLLSTTPRPVVTSEGRGQF